MSYNITSHTADIGIKEKAKDIKTLFKKCANNIVKLALREKNKKIKLKKIALSVKNNSNSYEELLHDFLNEIIFYIFVKKIYPKKIIIKNLLTNKIEAKIYCRKIIVDEILRELKSVTYHNLIIIKNKDGYVVKFIIDT